MTLKEIIKAKGMNLEAARAKMKQLEGENIKQTSFSKIVNSANPTVKTLQRFADVLECDVTDLFIALYGHDHSPAITCPVCGAVLHLAVETKEEGGI